MGLEKRTQGSHSESRDANIFVERCRKMRTQFVLTVVVASLALQTATKGQESRIAGGQIAPPGKYPSIARLSTSQAEGFNLSVCVLLILNRDWLVGPASCFADRNGPKPFQFFTVIVGDEIINETEPFEQGLKVERVIFHHRLTYQELESNGGLIDNIALVKVRPQIRFNNRVTAANLPSCKDFQTGIVGMVAGYGFRPVNNQRLMEITNKIISLDECSRRLAARGANRLDDRFFCVESINNMTSCTEDWGAPFFEVKSDHHMVLVGFLFIWPAGADCTGVVRGAVSIFIRLSSYAGWIHRRISGCGNHPWFNNAFFPSVIS